VSGEPTVVFAPTPAVRKLVDPLRKVVQVPGLNVVLIGGLAVACRLAHVHRSTGDADLVADEETESPVATLVRAGIGVADPTSEQRVYVDEAKLEVIGTSPVPDPVAVEDDEDRLFVLGHRWAFETGTICHLLVEGLPRTTLAVATPAASTASPRWRMTTAPIPPSESCTDVREPSDSAAAAADILD